MPGGDSRCTSMSIGPRAALPSQRWLLAAAAAAWCTNLAAAVQLIEAVVHKGHTQLHEGAADLDAETAGRGCGHWAWPAVPAVPPHRQSVQWEHPVRQLVGLQGRLQAAAAGGRHSRAGAPAKHDHPARQEGGAGHAASAGLERGRQVGGGGGGGARRAANAPTAMRLTRKPNGPKQHAAHSRTSGSARRARFWRSGCRRAGSRTRPWRRLR